LIDSKIFDELLDSPEGNAIVIEFSGCDWSKTFPNERPKKSARRELLEFLAPFRDGDFNYFGVSSDNVRTGRIRSTFHRDWDDPVVIYDLSNLPLTESSSDLLALQSQQTRLPLQPQTIPTPASIIHQLVCVMCSTEFMDRFLSTSVIDEMHISDVVVRVNPGNGSGLQIIRYELTNQLGKTAGYKTIAFAPTTAHRQQSQIL